MALPTQKGRSPSLDDGSFQVQRLHLQVTLHEVLGPKTTFQGQQLTVPRDQPSLDDGEVRIGSQHPDNAFFGAQPTSLPRVATSTRRVETPVNPMP